MSENSFNWKICGPAGEGIKSTGMIFSKTCLRHGFSTFDYTEYPSLIRGGHNTYQVYVSTNKVYSQHIALDLLVALNENTIKFHANELKTNGIIIYDEQDSKIDIGKYVIPGKAISVPLVALTKSVGADRLMYNNVALGVSMFLLNLDINILFSVIKETFQSKGDNVVKLNIDAAEAGYAYAKQNLTAIDVSLQKQTQNDTLTLSGNEALSLGAIAGGMKAYFAYPMTPASTILTVLAEWAPKSDIFVKHGEDGIGVINMALGASFAGVRTAVGTSGGGFCLMTEGIGLAGVTELPIVIYDAMRPGPATGMPTWTGQGDLEFAIWASQDENPRVVLAPSDVFEAFELSRLSFELAEQCQLPVIVLSDKYLSESNQSTHFANTKFNFAPLSRDNNPVLDETGFFKRYENSETGVSLRTVAGQKDGFFIANSYEHDVHGIASEEISDRNIQATKRLKKMESLRKSTPIQFYDGGENPEITFVSFGSTLSPIKEALPTLRSMGIDAAAFDLSWLWPFPSDQVTAVLNKSKNVVVVEGNALNQLAKLIRQETGIDIYHKRSKIDGRPFYPEEIINYAKEILHR